MVTVFFFFHKSDGAFETFHGDAFFRVDDRDGFFEGVANCNRHACGQAYDSVEDVFKISDHAKNF